MIGSLTARIFAIFWLTLALVLMLVLMLPKLDSRQMTELLDSEQRQGLMIEQHVEAELANDPPNDLMWWRRLFRAIDKWAPPGQRLLLVTTEGRVIGARVEAGGKVINVRARKGVVIAGGNFKSNISMRRYIDPRFARAEIPATGYPHYEDDGSAILAGLKAGAMFEAGRGEDTPYMRRMFGTSTYGFPKGSKFGHPGIGVKGRRWGDVIFTNETGKRFVREEDKKDLGGFTFYDMALVQPNLVVWTIFDEAAAKKNHWSIKEDVCEPGYAFKADTIEALAEMTHQPELAAQVARYNGFVDAGKDEEFGKPAALLKTKIAQGPFYAVRLVVFLHNCPGGLSINDNAQVLDITGKPIEGLYAAGESCGGLYVGNGMPRGIIPGRWAGEHAAAAKAA